MEKVYQDCPICGKKNVVGNFVKDVKFHAAETGLGAIAGASFGSLILPGVGTFLGAALGAKLGKGVANTVDEAREYKEYRFICPSCSHDWTKTI